MKHNFLIIMCLLGLLNPMRLVAEPASVLRDFYQSTTTLTAKFTQTTVDKDQKRVQESAGSFLLRRPNQFRWDYDQPYQQQIIADGNYLWVYDIDLEQVSVRKQKEALNEGPASLLTGNYAALEKQFRIIDSTTEEATGLVWVSLESISESNEFAQVKLAFDKQQINQLVIADRFGQRTLIQLSDVAVNPTISRSKFRFTPPKGVDVIGDSPLK